MVVAAPRYRKFHAYLRDTFGEKVYRVGLGGGFTCPNRDGTLGLDGCTFCNPESSEPLGYVRGTPIREQLARGIEYVRRRHGAGKFIAYFSDYTSTYAHPEELAALCREAIEFPGIVGLTLGTRPDCLSPAILEVLEALGSETVLWVELGVQSAHDRSLERVGRRHTVATSRKAIARLRAIGAAVCGHVILGLPGETVEDMLVTARFLAETRVDGVKIHNLHVVKDTVLAEHYRTGRYTPMALDDYVDAVVRFLEWLPPEVVVQRITGEAPRRLTVAPAWSVNKLAVANAIERELACRDTWQGRALGASLADVRSSGRSTR